MSAVLLVSKPVAPPWNDSGKNLVRDLARSMRRHDPFVMVRRGDRDSLGLGRATLEPLYSAGAGGFAPPFVDNLRVLARLAVGARRDLWHFFFAPNPRTSRAGRAAVLLRRVPSVQTISSAPTRGARLSSLLFADRIVVLSEHTERIVLGAGVARSRVVRIAPAIEPLEPLDDAERRAARKDLGLPAHAPIVLFPGDLEFGNGAAITLAATARLGRDVVLVMACRQKTPRAREHARRLEQSPEARELGARVVWLGETPRIHALLGAVDVVALATDSLFAKMDYPLVALEAMSLERPVVVAKGTPAQELGRRGGAIAVDPAVEPLAEALRGLLDDEQARRRVGEAGRSHVLAELSRETMAARYEDLYDEML